MIEVKYYYTTKNGTIKVGYAYFINVEKAIRFIYKLNRSKKLTYSGEFTCDDPYDTELINRRIK